MWLFKEVPQALLDPAKGARPEELWLLHLLLGGVKDPGLNHHLLHPVEGHELAGLVVALLAARLQVELVDAPIVEVLLEGNHAALLRVILSRSKSLYIFSCNVCPRMDIGYGGCYTGCFFHWYPPKKLMYGKPRLGESMLT